MITGVKSDDKCEMEVVILKKKVVFKNYIGWKAI